mgnify:CR=1 FL=1
MQLIQTHAALEAALPILQASPTLALDTEFVRVKTYYAQLALLQLATREHVFVIDPLKGLDLTGLWRVLAAPDTTLIVHSGEQDLQILWKEMGAPIQAQMAANIFDTQMAAALVGQLAGLDGTVDLQISYAQLVQLRAGVSLSKAYQRLDWSMRPLPQPALDYAADDVRYLHGIFDELQTQLADLGRSAWLVEDCQRAYAPRRMMVDESAARWGAPTGMMLTALQQRQMQALAVWRERTAMVRNLPRGWLIEDEQLLRLVLGVTNVGTERFWAKYGDGLTAVMQLPETALPPAPAQFTKLTPEQKDQVQSLQTQVQATAQRLNIHAGVVASRKLLERVVRGDVPSRLRVGWRAGVLGL